MVKADSGGLCWLETPLQRAEERGSRKESRRPTPESWWGCEGAENRADCWRVCRAKIFFNVKTSFSNL